MKKRNSLFLAALLACLSLLAAGCMSRQLEEQLLVIILGVDQTPQGEVRLTVKVPSNAAGGGGGGGESGGGASASAGGDQMGYLLLEATGKKFAEAVTLLHATTPRTLNFSQVREVVVGENAAKSADFGRLLSGVYALPRMRAQAVVVVCKGEANAFTEAQKPFVGTRLSRYVETTISNYAGKGFVPTTNLSEGLRDLGYGFQDPLFVLGAVNEFKESAASEKNNPLDETPGALPRKSVNKVEKLGAAATDGVAVSGQLTGYEMALIHLLRGDVQSLTLELDENTSTPIYARVPATLQVDLSARPAVLRAQMVCECHYAPGLAPDAESIRQRLTEDILRMIRRLQALRCDGIGFGNIAVRQFMTVPEWEKLHWRSVYTAAQVEVTLSIQLREN